jgi:hypothetical protein
VRGTGRIMRGLVCPEATADLHTRSHEPFEPTDARRT